MTKAADPGPAAPSEIIFSNGNRAVLVDGPGTRPGGLLAAAGLSPEVGSGGVILVCGGADGLAGAPLTRAEEMLGPAVSAAAQVTGAVVFDGGTSSGVMALTGAARARRPEAMPVLVGVAPAGLVSYPGGCPVVTGSGWRRTIRILFSPTAANGAVRPRC